LGEFNINNVPGGSTGDLYVVGVTNYTGISSRINVNSNLDIGDVEVTINYNLASLSSFKTQIDDIKQNQNSKARISFIGDSITEGRGEGTDKLVWLEDGYVGQINSLFTDKMDDVGNGLISSKYAFYEKFWDTSLGTWNTIILYGVFETCVYSNTPEDLAKIDFDGDGIRFYYQGTSGSGQIGFTIDGGTETIITPEKGGSSYYHDITGAGAGSHTLTVRVVDGLCFLLGAEEIKGTHGVVCNRNALAGTTADVMATNQESMNLAIVTEEADLVVISLLANDTKYKTLETFETSVQTLITNAKAHTNNVLLTSIGIRDPYDQTTQPDYVDVLRNLAITNNIALYDSFKEFGSWANVVANGYEVDTVHLNKEGNAVMAKGLFGILNR